MLPGEFGTGPEPRNLVVREGLRLVEEREAKLKALRQTVEASLTEGGALSQDEVSAALSAKAQALSKEGFWCADWATSRQRSAISSRSSTT
jgi:antitoxin ParD1/3/4